MATNFSKLIGDLHDNAILTDSVSDDTILIVDNKRQITAGRGFDTVVAYEGDINSQIVTIKINRTYDAHDLSKCEYKELRWKNLGSGVEGISNLIDDKTNTSTDFLSLSWEVPSDACTQAGTLEISLVFYDKSGEYVVFAWNTAKYTGLSIGKTIDSVNFVFPPKDEILIIDKDSKNIVAPTGYNNTFCNFGDIGTSELYFLINRYIGKNEDLDILAENVDVSIYVRFDNILDETKDNIERRLYTEEIANRNKEGLVFIKWLVPNSITCNINNYVGKIDIVVKFSSNEKTWYSNMYSNLTIGNNDIIMVELDDGEHTNTDQINKIIDEYFENQEVIFDSN